MQFREDDIDRAMRAVLGVPLKVAIAREAAEVCRLTPGEVARFHQVAATPRRDSWLRGRAALKRLLTYLGEEQDTSALAFPHRWFSLTHSGEYAVALGTEGTGLKGIGIDLELNRVPRPEAARFFLSPREQRWAMHMPESARPMHLLRLWTVKEALFKSDPQNRATGLLDYCLEDPANDNGKAYGLGESPLYMRYASLHLGQGFLSIVIACQQEAIRCSTKTTSGS